MLVEPELPDDPALLRAMLVEARDEIVARDTRIAGLEVSAPRRRLKSRG